MEMKDWISIIVPIICNGILIWLMQMLLERKQNIADRFSQLQEEIFRTYITRLDETLTIQRKLIHTFYPKLDIDSFAETCVEFGRAVETLIFHYEKYAVVLSVNDSVKDDFDKLKDTFNEWLLAQDQGGIGLEYLESIRECIQNLMSSCLEHIYGIKNRDK